MVIFKHFPTIENKNSFIFIMFPYENCKDSLCKLWDNVRALEKAFFQFYYNNYPLVASPEPLVTIQFSTTIQGSNYLRLIFDGVVDASNYDFTFTYTFPNTKNYNSIEGSIYFLTTSFPAKQHMTVINSSDGIEIFLRLPNTLASLTALQFEVTVVEATVVVSPPPTLAIAKTTSASYPAGFEIAGYFLWQGNFTNSSAAPITQYYCESITSPQTSYTAPSYATTGTGSFAYTDQIPSGVNSVFLFTGYSNAASALSNLTNYTTGSNMLSTAQTYLQSLGTPYLLGLCLGGGEASTGGWSTGSSGAIYSIYQAGTQSGVSFSYRESATGDTLTGTGTGILNNTYNSLLFDIETWTGSSGSTGIDFINLFQYLKNNTNSTFYTYKCIIIVSIAHSCSNYNGTGQSVISTLLSDSTGSYDYIDTQMYTENIGTTNEYCANYNILWTGSNGFVSYLNQNANYITYGNYFILPAINLPNLYTGPGTNTTGNPNLYFYQSSGNTTDPITETPTGYITIPYTTDTGVTSFFQAITNSSTPLGGYIQWVNGTI